MVRSANKHNCTCKTSTTVITETARVACMSCMLKVCLKLKDTNGVGLYMKVGWHNSKNNGLKKAQTSMRNSAIFIVQLQSAQFIDM